MNLKQIAILVSGIGIASATALPVSAESANWKDTNSQAIDAMRHDKLDEAEHLFQEALSQCSSDDGRQSIQTNLEVLHDKMGIQSHASAEQHSSNSTVQSSGQSSNSQADEIHAYIKQLDEQIKKADASDDLETLQSLFQKKAHALKVRDDGETLDYAYCLHFRAQVLQHLHRDSEAQALEAQASQLRDQLKKLSAQPVRPPARLRSGLSKLNYNFQPAPTQTQTAQDSYPPVVPNYGRNPMFRRNIIDRNTTNIQNTPGPTSTVNPN